MISSSPLPFAALLFDLDGVLVDSEPAANRVWVELLAGHGLSVSHADFLERSVGRTHQELHDGLRRDYGWTRPPDFDALSDAALALAFLEVEAVPGASATLATLEAAGIPYAVASNSRRDRLDLKLRAAGLDGQVQLSLDPALVGGRGKPLPDLYLRAAEELGQDIRACLVVEDSATGVQAGVAAGARVWGLTAGGHAGPGLAAQLLEAGAERVVGSHAELREALGLGGAEQGNSLPGQTTGGR